MDKGVEIQIAVAKNEVDDAAVESQLAAGFNGDITVATATTITVVNGLITNVV